MAVPARRPTTCQLFTSQARNGLKFFAYAYLMFTGLYTEDGYVLRGTEGQSNSVHPPIPAPATDTPKVCCGQLGV